MNYKSVGLLLLCCSTVMLSRSPSADEYVHIDFVAQKYPAVDRGSLLIAARDNHQTARQLPAPMSTGKVLSITVPACVIGTSYFACEFFKNNTDAFSQFCKIFSTSRITFKNVSSLNHCHPSYGVGPIQFVLFGFGCGIIGYCYGKAVGRLDAHKQKS